MWILEINVFGFYIKEKPDFVCDFCIVPIRCVLLVFAVCNIKKAGGFWAMDRCNVLTLCLSQQSTSTKNLASRRIIWTQLVT